MIKLPYTNPWLALWARSMDIAVGAPEVVSRRLALFSRPGPWNASTMLEAQRMVAEKMIAAGEVGWSLWRSGFALKPMTVNQAAGRANTALKPVSRRVNANVRRLRSKP